MWCCRSPACRPRWRWDCSARRRCPSRPRWRAAAPTRWHCASAPSSPIRCGGERGWPAAGGGAGLILGLNTVRIGTLGRAAASPAWFNALHLYVWPAVLTLAIAGYVFAWMRVADRRQARQDTTTRGRAETSSARAPAAVAPIRRAHGGVSASVLGRLAALSREFRRPRAGRLHRPRGGGDLGVVGVSAHAAANVLWTPRGGFLVTQECISTPLHPGLSGSRLCLLDHMAAAGPGRPRRAAALHRSGHRAAAGRRAA